MDILEAILTRRSIRKYENKPVEEALVKELLAAAMAAPSAGNQQPWHFVVVTEREKLDALSHVHPYVTMLRQAPLAILVCADPKVEKFPGNWVLDCAAATQNLLLAAHGLGLGAVWTGLYPDAARMTSVTELMKLPAHIQPHSLVPLGWPAQKPGRQDRYNDERVHHNGW